MDSEIPWFSPATVPAGEFRLFCFPFAGGNASAFLPWQELLGARVELRVAVLPGRGIRLLEKPLSEMDGLVAELSRAVAELEGKPFAFFGHSLGALIAFEVARALRAQGLPGPASLWVAGAEGPQTRVLKRRLHDLPDAELIEALRGYNGTPDVLLDNEEMMDLLLPGLRADFTLGELYTYRAEAPLDVPVHLLHGDEDPYVDAALADGWAHESSRPLRRYGYEGDHFFVFPHQKAITELLVRGL